MYVCGRWLEAFAVNKKYLPVVMFNAIDLSEGGIANSVLGALPLFRTPFAMRPHYAEKWVDDVKKHNHMVRATTSRSRCHCHAHHTSATLLWWQRPTMRILMS